MYKSRKRVASNEWCKRLAVGTQLSRKGRWQVHASILLAEVAAGAMFNIATAEHDVLCEQERFDRKGHVTEC